MAASPRLRSTVRIMGRALDSNNQGLANVVVVLISTIRVGDLSYDRQ